MDLHEDQMYFIGDTEVFNGLKNLPKYSFNHVTHIRDLMDNYDSVPVLLQIGRRDGRIYRDCDILLYLKCIITNTERKIVLTSFLSYNYLCKQNSIFGYFSFLRLPEVTTILIPKETLCVEKALFECAQNIEFEKRYLYHEVKHKILPKKVLKIFTKNMCRYGANK